MKKEERGRQRSGRKADTVVNRRKDRQTDLLPVCEKEKLGLAPPHLTHQWLESSPGDGCEPASPPGSSAGAWLGSRPQRGSKQSALGTASADSLARQTPGWSQ